MQISSSKRGAWNDEYSGVDSTTVSGKQFIKFSNGNLIRLNSSMREKLPCTKAPYATPNRLALGANVFNELKKPSGDSGES